MSAHIGIIVGYTTPSAELTRLSSAAEMPMNGVAVPLVMILARPLLMSSMPPILLTMFSREPTARTITMVPQGRDLSALPSSAMPNRNSRAATLKAARPMLTLTKISSTSMTTMLSRAMICLALNFSSEPRSIGCSGVLTLWPLKMNQNTIEDTTVTSVWQTRMVGITLEMPASAAAFVMMAASGVIGVIRPAIRPCSPMRMSISGLKPTSTAMMAESAGRIASAGTAPGPTPAMMKPAI